MKLVAPFGFYGWGNIGDEATLQGFATLMACSDPAAHVWVASRNPGHTARVEPRFRYYKMEGWDPRRRWARLRAAGVVVAGGTPIMDVLGRWPLGELVPIMEAMHCRGKSISFVGIGTEKLERDDSKRDVAEKLARFVRHWSVRCGFDKERLVEYGVRPEAVTVAADMAWLLEPVSADWGRRLTQAWSLSDSRILGVNLLGEAAVLQREPQLFEKLAQFLDAVVDRYELKVLFLSNEVREHESYDKSAALRTLNLMRHQREAFVAPNDYLSPQQMMSLIANCYATVGMRYHFCLFSALQGIPFIALKRSDKVADLCSDLAWTYGAQLKGDLLADRLIEAFGEIELQRVSLADELSVSVAALRERALGNLAALDSRYIREPRHAQLLRDRSSTNYPIIQRLSADFGSETQLHDAAK
jgi:polysaccharide pyruvyl transferase WcaK-like protein